jgi:hypothetical protein
MLGIIYAGTSNLLYGARPAAGQGEGGRGLASRGNSAGLAHGTTTAFQRRGDTMEPERRRWMAAASGRMRQVCVRNEVLTGGVGGDGDGDGDGQAGRKPGARSRQLCDAIRTRGGGGGAHDRRRRRRRLESSGEVDATSLLAWREHGRARRGFVRQRQMEAVDSEWTGLLASFQVLPAGVAGGGSSWDLWPHLGPGRRAAQLGPNRASGWAATGPGPYCVLCTGYGGMQSASLFLLGFACLGGGGRGAERGRRDCQSPTMEAQSRQRSSSRRRKEEARLWQSVAVGVAGRDEWQWAVGRGPWATVDTDSAPSRPRGNVGISFSGRARETKSIGSRLQSQHPQSHRTVCGVAAVCHTGSRRGPSGCRRRLFVVVMVAGWIDGTWGDEGIRSEVGVWRLPVSQSPVPVPSAQVRNQSPSSSLRLGIRGGGGGGRGIQVEGRNACGRGRGREWPLDAVCPGDLADPKRRSVSTTGTGTGKRAGVKGPGGGAWSVEPQRP